MILNIVVTPASSVQFADLASYDAFIARFTTDDANLASRGVERWEADEANLRVTLFGPAQVNDTFNADSTITAAPA